MIIFVYVTFVCILYQSATAMKRCGSRAIFVGATLRGASASSVNPALRICNCFSSQMRRLEKLKQIH